MRILLGRIEVQVGDCAPKHFRLTHLNASAAAPKPLSMLTTPTPGLHELSLSQGQLTGEKDGLSAMHKTTWHSHIVSSALTPPNEAP
jgi:hypothetical protein